MSDAKRMSAQEKEKLQALGAQLLEQRGKKAAAQAARREKQKAAGLVSLSITIPAEQAQHVRKAVALLEERKWFPWALCVAKLAQDKSKYEWIITRNFGELPKPPQAPSDASSVERR